MNNSKNSSEFHVLSFVCYLPALQLEFESLGNRQTDVSKPEIVTDE